MKVRDAMASTVRSVQPTATVAEVAQIMKSEDTGFVPVIEDGNRLVGVVTDRDIVIRCIAQRHDGCLDESVEHVMSTELRTIGPDEELEVAADIMQGAKVRRLAVTEADQLIGVLSHGNLVQAMPGGGAARTATEGVTRGA